MRNSQRGDGRSDSAPPPSPAPPQRRPCAPIRTSIIVCVGAFGCFALLSDDERCWRDLGARFGRFGLVRDRDGFGYGTRIPRPHDVDGTGVRHSLFALDALRGEVLIALCIPQ